MHTPPVDRTSSRTLVWRVVAAVGLALFAVAALFFAMGSADARAWGIPAALGAAMLVAAGAANARSVTAFLGRRESRRGADAFLSTLFLAAILVVVQATSMRRSHTFDLTRNHRHTLSPQTTALLDSLDRDVEVTGFFRQASARRDGAEDLFALYAGRSHRFRASVVDPDRQPDLARRLGASLDEVVVQADDARRVVRTVDEESLTNAILSVTRTGTRAVYFVTGHGEKDPQVSDREGYSAVRHGLESQGYVVRAASLMGGAPVPDDCAVLVLAGPRQDYFAEEVTAVRRYLDAGGSLLALIDPRVEVPRLAQLFARYHLGLVDAVVLDELALDAGDRSFDATVAKVRRYESHPITRDFNYVTMFPRARPVVIAEDSVVAGLEARYLCISDDRAWGEVDMESFAIGRATRDGADIAGPLPIAAAATRTPLSPAGVGAGSGKSRVVLVGDSDFAGNTMYNVLGNSDFFLNAIAFLSEDENMIRIRPRRPLGESVYITERQGRMVFLVCLVLLPLTPIVTGAVVVARRRRL
ncbi:MAG TPA: Gldg family protein [Candidatus Krumholzibacteria bacterium]|nr:Gldg family protein [Candidatus Krumholzibacteria bacterium]